MDSNRKEFIFDFQHRFKHEFQPKPNDDCYCSRMPKGGSPYIKLLGYVAGAILSDLRNASGVVSLG